MSGESGSQDTSQRQADGPASPSGRGLPAYYGGQDANRPPNVLSRALSNFNPFKVQIALYVSFQFY